MQLEKSWDLSRDTWNLRSGASFQTEISKGLFWIPFASLSGPRLTNGECKRLMEEPLEERKKQVACLYEAVQLFQNSGFEEIKEKPRFTTEDGLFWQDQLSPWEAQKQNRGSCCEIASWLYAIAAPLFDEAGYLMIERPGNGHVMNYFRMGSRYYFVDLNTQHVNYKEQALIETGSRADYYHTRFFTSAFLTCGSLEQFAAYYSKLVSLTRTEFLFAQLSEERIPPLASAFEENKKIVYLPSSVKVIPLNHPKNIHIAHVDYTPEEESPLRRMVRSSESTE